MLKEIQNLVVRVDHSIWYYLNTQWHNSFLDFVVPYLRNQYFWSPLYLFLLIFLPYNFGKRGWIWCAAYLLAFALSFDEVVVTTFTAGQQTTLPIWMYLWAVGIVLSMSVISWKEWNQGKN